MYLSAVKFNNYADRIFFGRIFSTAFCILNFINLKILTMNNSKIFISVLIGVSAGIVAGLLFAPDKGSETRRKVAETSGKLVTGVKDAAENVKEFAQNSTNAISDAKNKLFKKGEKVADNFAEKSY
ncbi:MAG: YtxH domain-containing protein [Chitinophagales bacterium]|nr:YtxH domain-containing protein [Chitinophagales bacterium]